MPRLQSCCGCCKYPKDIAKWTIYCFEGKEFNSNLEGNNIISSSSTISKNDINGFFHVTTKHGPQNHIKIMVIPWDHFEDFFQGEQKNLECPSKFTSKKEQKICNPLNTLTHPKTNSASLFYKCCLFFKVFLLQNNAFGFIFLYSHWLPTRFWNVPYVKQFVF